MTFWLKENEPVALLYMGVEKMEVEPMEKRYFCIQEVQVTGEGRLGPHMGMIDTLPGNRMVYIKHEDNRNENGRIVKIYTKDKKTGLSRIMSYQFFDGIPVIRCENLLKNEGEESMARIIEIVV